MKIGFIGLGYMGSRMAMNILKNQYELIVYNRTKEKAGELVQNGAKLAEGPSDLAKDVDVLFSMLANPEVVEQLALGKEGFLDSLKKGSIWVDCSTVNPSFSVKMANLSKEKEINFLDAPVAGTIMPAEKGELVFLVGGDKTILDQCKPIIECMASKILYFGANGKGTSMKMVINTMLAFGMVGFSEAMSLGKSLEIDTNKLMDVLLSSAVSPPFLSYKKEIITKGDYDKTRFPLKWMRKDLVLATKSAYETGIAMPVTNLVKEMFALASEKGYAEKDFSAVFDLYKRSLNNF
ncbi:MAG: NAD(P)-dependent oxidoreductase [Candidatus Lokiarchaeota archaeon]